MFKHLKEWMLVLAIIIGTLFIVSIGLTTLFVVLTSKFFITVLILEVLVLLIISIIYRIQN